MGQVTSIFSRGKDIFYGRHEVVTYPYHGEVNTYNQSLCSKVFGCRDMIPVYEFNRNNLPDPYKNMNDIYELTQALASLTIRLKTQSVSANRPQYIPGTEVAYPLYEYRGQRFLATGTGRVCDVVMNTKRKCKCRKCIVSETPSQTWWSIKIFTATHVVFDEGEAKDTTCTLFYDREGDTDQRVHLVGCEITWMHTSGDLCLLKTATCDGDLANNLFTKIKEFNKYWKSLKVMYEKDKKKEQLVIIVSHAHGKAKRISVGKGVDVGTILNLGYNKYIYTTPTCTGTSGGPVYILGYDWFSTEFVHLGTMIDNTAKLGKTSSIGMESFSEYFSTNDTNVSFLSYSTAYEVLREPKSIDDQEWHLQKSFSESMSDTVSKDDLVNRRKSSKLSIDGTTYDSCKFCNYSSRWY